MKFRANFGRQRSDRRKVGIEVEYVPENFDAVKGLFIHISMYPFWVRLTAYTNPRGCDE